MIDRTSHSNVTPTCGQPHTFGRPRRLKILAPGRRGLESHCRQSECSRLMASDPEGSGTESIIIDYSSARAIVSESVASRPSLSPLEARYRERRSLMRRPSASVPVAVRTCAMRRFSRTGKRPIWWGRDDQQQVHKSLPRSILAIGSGSRSSAACWTRIGLAMARFGQIGEATSEYSSSVADRRAEIGSFGSTEASNSLPARVGVLGPTRADVTSNTTGAGAGARSPRWPPPYASRILALFSPDETSSRTGPSTPQR
jgi:hypothetical protein